MAAIHRLHFATFLLNSSCPWASSIQDLEKLYASPFTGAVTTRTATLDGFDEDPSVHQVAFSANGLVSLNSFGYSPHPLSAYISWVESLIVADPHSKKPIIISITSSSADTLARMVEAIQSLRHRLQDYQGDYSRIGIELNTSCPNIKDAPPPAYEPESLMPLLKVFVDHYEKDPTLTIGLKLPPYVHSRQFADVVRVVASLSMDDGSVVWNPIAFLTCTNTLGSCVIFDEQIVNPGSSASFAALPTVFGGLAGESIHPLSLGNVHAFSQLLQSHPSPALRKIAVIGVGGVTSAAAAQRMRTAGATVVACATALGKEGVGVFERLLDAK